MDVGLKKLLKRKITAEAQRRKEKMEKK